MVKRFQAIGTDEDPYMVPTTKGPWVRHSDYEALERHLAEARAEIDRLEVALRMPGADRRLWYISDLLARTGHFNRRDICEAFKISVPQASADIKRWLTVHPYTAAYNKSSKRYEIDRAALAGKE